MASPGETRAEVFLGSIRDLLAISDEIIQSRKFTWEGNEELPFAQVTSVAFVGAAKTTRSILLLLDHRQPEAAFALSRSLAETLISLVYLAKEDRANRSKLFIYQVVVQDEKQRRLCERTPGLENFLKNKTVEGIRERFADLEVEFGNENARKMLSWISWSGKNFEVMARETGLSNTYVMGQGFANRAVHAANFPSHCGEDPRNPGKLVLKNSPCEVSREFACRSTALNFLCILNHINELFRFGFDDRIEEICKRICPTKSITSSETNAASASPPPAPGGGALTPTGAPPEGAGGGDSR